MASCRLQQGQKQYHLLIIMHSSQADCSRDSGVTISNQCAGDYAWAGETCCLISTHWRHVSRGLLPISGAGWRFRCANKKNFQQRGARLTATDFHRGTGILVVAFSSGLFELYQVRVLPRQVALFPQKPQLPAGLATGELCLKSCIVP